jgi:hypothetical protein
MKEGQPVGQEKNNSDKKWLWKGIIVAGVLGAIAILLA